MMDVERSTAKIEAGSLSLTEARAIVRDLFVPDERISNVVVRKQTEIEAIHGNRHIEAIDLRNSATKSRLQVPCAAVFVFIGAEPSAQWLLAEIARDTNGYVLTGGDAVRSGLWPRADRDPCPLETSVPGILAAGDIRSGSTKRVGFAVGDGSLAVTCAHRLLSITR